MLITNVNMPELTGHQLARQIRLTRPDIRIIIVSGDKEETFPPDAKEHNVALLKPIDPKQLIIKVRALLPACAA